MKPTPHYITFQSTFVLEYIIYNDGLQASLVPFFIIIFISCLLILMIDFVWKGVCFPLLCFYASLYTSHCIIAPFCFVSSVYFMDGLGGSVGNVVFFYTCT